MAHFHSWSYECYDVDVSLGPATACTGFKMCHTSAVWRRWYCFEPQRKEHQGTNLTDTQYMRTAGLPHFNGNGSVTSLDARVAQTAVPSRWRRTAVTPWTKTDQRLNLLSGLIQSHANRLRKWPLVPPWNVLRNWYHLAPDQDIKTNKLLMSSGSSISVFERQCPQILIFSYNKFIFLHALQNISEFPQQATHSSGALHLLAVCSPLFPRDITFRSIIACIEDCTPVLQKTELHTWKKDYLDLETETWHHCFFMAVALPAELTMRDY